MIKNATISLREQKILDFIENSGPISTQYIVDFLNEHFAETSRYTVIRILNKLETEHLIEKTGAGRGVKYVFVQKHRLPETYFQEHFLKREPVADRFSINIFEKLNNIFTKTELELLEQKTKIYRSSVVQLSPTILKKEFERLTIELAWKSSQIEGNTYSLLETEGLLKDNILAKGHSNAEAIMLLNHKKTLEDIYQNKEKYKNISVRDVEYIHSLLSQNLGITSGVRRNAVGITGTQYRPLDVPEKIHEALIKLVEKINSVENPFEKALIALACIAYVQPFEDGNKRTSRLVADAILLAYNFCPISYRSIDVIEYKKAMILFYEQHDIFYIKQLFIDQYIFSIDNYFRA